MKKGFTLIELLAVIVILAIIALIATPIVLSIIDEKKIKLYNKKEWRSEKMDDYLIKLVYEKTNIIPFLLCF